jgi:ABC-type multidrug transport system ATPase subunit
MCKTYPSRKKLKNIKGDSTGDSVADINFTVAKNEVLGILGPSGAGKSSIFKIVTLAMNRSGGQVELLNQKLGMAKDANEILTKG